MPPKKPTKKAPNREVEEDGETRGSRTVMQPVDALPEAPALGRPNTKYLKLFEAVAGEFGPGVPVKLVEYADPRSARRILNQIESGSTPVPGGPREWAVRALVEQIEGQTEKGSALYVEWLGES